EIEIQNCTASELVNPHAFVRDFDGHFSRPHVMMVEHSPSRLQGNPSPCLRCPGGPTFRNLHAVEDDEQTGAIGSNLDHGAHLLGHGLLLSLPSRIYGRQPDPAKAGALEGG